MHMPFKPMLAAGLALLLGVGPALSAEYDPRGLWQTTSGESRYHFVYCGDGNDKLCATLVWLNANAMQTPARHQLGTYAYSLADRTGSNTWRGDLTYDGKHTQATVTLTGPKHLTISGCYLIWCKSFDLVKISTTAAQ